MDWNENDDNAYILEVVLEYPKDIHDKQSDYPSAPENMKIEEKRLSQVYGHYYNGKEATDEKEPNLILNQLDKKNYVVHLQAFTGLHQEGDETNESPWGKISAEVLVETVD